MGFIDLQLFEGWHMQFCLAIPAYAADFANIPFDSFIINFFYAPAAADFSIAFVHSVYY